MEHQYNLEWSNLFGAAMTDSHDQPCNCGCSCGDGDVIFKRDLVCIAKDNKGRFNPAKSKDCMCVYCIFYEEVRGKARKDTFKPEANSGGLF